MMNKALTTKASSSALAFSTLVLITLGTIQSGRATVVNLDGTGGAANFNASWTGAAFASGGITSGAAVSYELSMNNGVGIVQNINTVGLSFNLGNGTLYFGGTLSLNGLVGGNSVWNTGGGQISLGFSGPNYGVDTWNVLTTQPDANHNIWGASVGSVWSVGVHDHFGNYYANSAQTVGNASFDFVLGVSGTGNDHFQTFSLWLGANADAATAGAADLTWSRGGSWDGPYYNVGDLASVGIGASLSDGTSLTTSHMFVSDTWNPVQAVPEPATSAMLLGGVGLLILFRRRRA